MQPPLRIIIIDDDPHARAGLRAFLSTHPVCTVVGEASNGADALAEIERSRPDALILDVHMPVLDGLQATRMVKERWPVIFVVAISVDARRREAALQAGADAFVSKMEAPRHLVAALQCLRD